MISECASCGIKADMRCVGCLDAPEYHPGDAISTVYCSRTCQTQHWPQHKVRCHTLSRRIKLLRAAHIFKAALLNYREVLYDIGLERIELQDGALCLHQRLHAVTTRWQIVRFPAHLTTNVEHRDAALLNNQCTLAMALLGRLVRKLLKASTIEVLDIHIGKPRLPTRLVPGPDASQVLHTVLNVRPRLTGETWVVDTAGSQYGFRDVLVPFDKYIADTLGRIVSAPATYDSTETKDLDYYATLGFMNKTEAQQQNLCEERKARLHFARFVDQGVGEEVLRGSTVEWKDKPDEFAAGLKAHLMELVI
ncbi:hypothetical protein CC86DRAFT_48047 [Ophiobolus disseminans]|uniref:MYND-type domain-containing protein n=1 Tax=Ophiobolus disseminans TaxID=1469910 RepID=A0A6A6ZVM3_9PLEO|nr:hypothetical protein CC86DRAFT_48047 [Ophiobolus disseminans]